MTQPNNPLGRIRKAANIKVRLGTLVSVVSLAFGCMFIVLAILAPGPGDLRALIIAVAAFLIGLGIGVYVAHRFRRRWHGELAECVSHNLTERDLLLVAMTADVGESMPSLFRGIAADNKAGAGTTTVPFADRMLRLATSYAHCCKDLGLQPYPGGFETVQKAFLIMMLLGLIGSAALQRLIEGPVWDAVKPVYIGLGFICFGMFTITRGMSELAVCDAIIEQLGDQPVMDEPESQ